MSQKAIEDQNLNQLQLAEEELFSAEQLRSGVELSSIKIDDVTHRARMTNLDQILGDGFIPIMPQADEIERVMALGDWRKDPELHQAMQKMSTFISERSKEALLQDDQITGQLQKLKKLFHSFDASSDLGQTTLMKQSIAHEIDKLKSEQTKLTEEGKDAFLAIHTRRIAEYANDLQEGRIVKVPYVREKIDSITASLRQYKPVFLHGETGTGKSEIAKLAALEYSGKEALLIRGYSGMDATELYGHMSLVANNLERASKLPDLIEREIDHYKQTHPEVSAKQLEKVNRQIVNGVLQQNSATYSEYVLGGVYRAIKERRVAILDEANYIPPDLLASLNDIMTKKPGEEINIQQNGTEPIIFEDGAGIILTGNVNLDETNKRYHHRFEIDSALGDRIGEGIIEYDFLPQAIDGQPHEHSFSDKQLYAVAVAALIYHDQLTTSADSVNGYRMDHSIVVKSNTGEQKLYLDPALVSLAELPNLGPLLLPEGALEQLWNLAKLSRITQKLFTKTLGVNDDYSLQQNHVPITVHADRAITNRGLISIVQNWKADGFTRELDSYLYDFLISEKTNVKQCALFYMNAQLQNFFQSEGWDVNDNYSSSLNGFKFKDPGNPGRPLKIVNSAEIVVALYGAPPERKAWPVESAGVLDSLQMQGNAAQIFEELTNFAQNCYELSEICIKFPFLKENFQEEEQALLEVWQNKEAFVQSFLSNQNLSKEELLAEARRKIASGDITKDSPVSQMLVEAKLLSESDF